MAIFAPDERLPSSATLLGGRGVGDIFGACDTRTDAASESHPLRPQHGRAVEREAGGENANRVVLGDTSNQRQGGRQCVPSGRDSKGDAGKDVEV